MTAIMEHRVPIMVVCIILLVSINLTYVMVVVSAPINDVELDNVMYTRSELEEQFKELKEDGDQYWEDVLAPQIASFDITRAQAEDIFYSKFGYHYGEFQASRWQFEEHLKGEYTSVGDQMWIKTSELSQEMIDSLNEGGMPTIVNVFFVLFNIIIALVLGIIVWSFVYDGLSLIPFVGK